MKQWLLLFVGCLALTGCVPDPEKDKAVETAKAAQATAERRAEAAENKLKAATTRAEVEVTTDKGKTVVVPKQVLREEVFQSPAPTESKDLPAYLLPRATSARIRADLEAIWRKAGESAERVAKAQAEKKLVVQAAVDLKTLVAGVRADGDDLKRLTGNLVANLDQAEIQYELLAMDLRGQAAGALPEFRDTLLALARTLETARDAVPRKKVLCQRYLAQLEAQASWFAGAERCLDQIASTYAVLTAGGLPITSSESAAAVDRLSKQYLSVLAEFTRKVSAQADPNRLPDAEGEDPRPAPPPPEPTPPPPVTVQSLGLTRPPDPVPPRCTVAVERYLDAFVCADCGFGHPNHLLRDKERWLPAGQADIRRARLAAQAEWDRDEPARERAVREAQAVADATYARARAEYAYLKYGKGQFAAWKVGRHPLAGRGGKGGAS